MKSNNLKIIRSICKRKEYGQIGELQKETNLKRIFFENVLTMNDTASKNF